MTLNDVARRGDRYPVEAFRHGLESTDGMSDRFSVDATAKKCASAKRRPKVRACNRLTRVCKFDSAGALHGSDQRHPPAARPGLRSSNQLEIQATRRRR